MKKEPCPRPQHRPHRRRFFLGTTGRPFRKHSNLRTAFEMALRGTTLEALRAFAVSCAMPHPESLVRALRVGTHRGFHWLVHEKKGTFKVTLAG
jgi:hypothetical protein